MDTPKRSKKIHLGKNLVIHGNAKIFDYLISQTKVVNGCWEWQKHLAGSGYGGKRINGKNCRVHRLVWEILNGPTKKLICHHCDNKKCCNPAHLFAGTSRDNVLDMYKKGRGRARFKKEEALMIRKLSKARVPDQVIAELFDAPKRTINQITNGKRYSLLFKA